MSKFDYSLESAASVEQVSNFMKGPILPCQTDVLFGPGKIHWEGNHMFDKEIQKRALEYRAAETRFEKESLVQKIIRTVQTWGRFLEQKIPDPESPPRIGEIPDPESQTGIDAATEQHAREWCLANNARIRKQVKKALRSQMEILKFKTDWHGEEENQHKRVRKECQINRDEEETINQHKRTRNDLGGKLDIQTVNISKQNTSGHKIVNFSCRGTVHGSTTNEIPSCSDGNFTTTTTSPTNENEKTFILLTQPVFSRSKDIVNRDSPSSRTCASLSTLMSMVEEENDPKNYYQSINSNDSDMLEFLGCENFNANEMEENEHPDIL